MALKSRNPESGKLANELAEQLADTNSATNTEALGDGRVFPQLKPDRNGVKSELEDIANRCASLPVLNSALVDEILGYDENGLPN
ncbi:MAG: type II toxin-antitoxin system VapB family antitoxin [Gammaproteobacteria bacterium]